MNGERNEKDTETVARRGRVFITYFQDLSSYNNVLKREGLGEE